MRTIDRNKNHWFILSDSGLHGHTHTNTWAWACITVASNRLNFYFAININRKYNSCQTEIVCQLLFTRVKLCYVIYTLDMDPRILHKFIELSHLSVYVCVYDLDIVPLWYWIQSVINWKRMRVCHVTSAPRRLIASSYILVTCILFYIHFPIICRTMSTCSNLDKPFAALLYSATCVNKHCRKLFM